MGYRLPREKWCAREVSNLHPLRDQILSLACLPFHHSRNVDNKRPATVIQDVLGVCRNVATRNGCQPKAKNCRLTPTLPPIPNTPKPRTTASTRFAACGGTMVRQWPAPRLRGK